MIDNSIYLVTVDYITTSLTSLLNRIYTKAKGLSGAAFSHIPLLALVGLTGLELLT